MNHRVVIVGGGFGGLYAAKTLKSAPVEVTLVDRRNFHLFQPLLYQVATGGLSPANIAYPLRATLKRQRNAQALLAEVAGFDLPDRRVQLRDGTLPFDSLIVAAGAANHYFGNPQWEAHAPGLKSIEDATRMRRMVLTAFEAAEREPVGGFSASWLTFVVVGGGPTGVELAGALAEIARYTLRREFRRINPADARILLVEAGDRILSAYAAELSEKAIRSLVRLGVEVRTRTQVIDVNGEGVTLRCGEDASTIRTRTVLWGAGIRANPLGQALAAAAGCEVDRAGRVLVREDCTVFGREDVYVIGDLASFPGPDGKPLPGIAPVAMQQGRYVAQHIRARLSGRKLPPFRYVDRGSMATIGRAAAVAEIGRLKFSGFPAWLLWLFVHVAFLIEFQNRLLVLVQWAWCYFTWGRSARLITEIASAQPGASTPSSTRETS